MYAADIQPPISLLLAKGVQLSCPISRGVIITPPPVSCDMLCAAVLEDVQFPLRGVALHDRAVVDGDSAGLGSERAYLPRAPLH